MSTLTGIIVFTGFGGLLSIVAAGTLLSLSKKHRNNLVPHLVSFATGALLGAAFLGLLPHALESLDSSHYHELGLVILIGIMTFFALEKTVLWRHCHDNHCEAHAIDGIEEAHSHGDYHVHDHIHLEANDKQRDHASGRMILVGDAVHNFIDGILIAAAFLTDFELGVVTALAVIAHEVPQEIGDVAILMNSGMRKKNVLITNLLASLTAVIGGLVGYFALKEFMPYLPYVLGFAASSFIYIAVADLIPGMHRKVDAKSSITQFVLIALGVFVVYLVHQNLH